MEVSIGIKSEEKKVSYAIAAKMAPLYVSLDTRVLLDMIHVVSPHFAYKSRLAEVRYLKGKIPTSNSIKLQLQRQVSNNSTKEFQRLNYVQRIFKVTAFVPFVNVVYNQFCSIPRADTLKEIEVNKKQDIEAFEQARCICCDL